MSSILPILQVIYNDLVQVSGNIHKSYMGQVDSLSSTSLTAHVAKHGGINVAINALDKAATWLKDNEGAPLPTSFVSPPAPEPTQEEVDAYTSDESANG